VNPSTEARLDALEARARYSDLADGVLASVDSATTALAAGHREHREEFAAFALATARELASLRRDVQRAAAAPIALVAGLVADAAGGTAQTTIVSTLAALVVALVLPGPTSALVGRLVAARTGQTPSERPPVRSDAHH
jgi:hypothetical protein